MPQLEHPLGRDSRPPSDLNLTTVPSYKGCLPGSVLHANLENVQERFHKRKLSSRLASSYALMDPSWWVRTTHYVRVYFLCTSTNTPRWALGMGNKTLLCLIEEGRGVTLSLFFVYRSTVSVSINRKPNTVGTREGIIGRHSRNYVVSSFWVR